MAVAEIEGAPLLPGTFHALPTHEQERLLGLRNARLIRSSPERLAAWRRGQAALQQAHKRATLTAAVQNLSQMTGGQSG